MNYDCSKCPVTLESFCEKDEDTRHSLALPVCQGDYVYATDGRIVVRMPANSYSGEVSKGRSYPAVEDLGWDKEVVRWEPVPEPQPCDYCNSRRTIPSHDRNIQVPCRECLVQIQDTSLAWHLVEPLTRFGTGLEVGLEIGTAGPMSAVHFRFDGGYALVMPLVTKE